MSLRWIGILLLACAPAWAQSRITGTVTDSSGAVVPAVEVVIKNVETGQATPAQTNQSGVYSVSFLNPGRYELSCEQAGFKKFVRAGIVLETGTTSTIDVVLNVGQISDVINVTASAPLLESESGALGQLVENKMILNMPIESRRVGALVRLMGNVTFSGEEGGQSIPKFSVAGGRSYNQMWNLDGGVAQNQSNGSPQLSLNPPNESLQEFKVLANNYPAEYGRSGSGYIVMTTKAGHQRISTARRTNGCATTSSMRAPSSPRIKRRCATTFSAAPSAGPSARTRPSSSSITRAGGGAPASR